MIDTIDEVVQGNGKKSGKGLEQKNDNEYIMRSVYNQDGFDNEKFIQKCLREEATYLYDLLNNTRDNKHKNN